MTFTEDDICHLMEPLRMLYSMTLIFVFKVKHFLLCTGYTKFAQAADVRGRFASTRAEPAV